MRKRVRALEYIVKTKCKNFTIYYKNEINVKLDIVALEHVFVPGVWIFDSFERAKPAGFGSWHLSDQEWSFPFAVHFPLLLALRDASKDKIAHLDLPRFHLLVFPPLRFGLVFGEIDCCLHFDHFDIVNYRLHVIFDRLLRPFIGSLGSESYFFWRHSLFSI